MRCTSTRRTERRPLTRHALALTLAFGATAPALRAQDSVPSCHEQPVEVRTATGTLQGTLRCPDGRGPWPVALLVAGGGNVDRDGNSSMQLEHPNTLALLAEGLAARGVATVRYDKRGVGGSADAARGDSVLRLATHALDAAEWVQQLQVDARFTSVTVVGYGEGALVGMLAARSADADGFVSLEGHGRPGAEIMQSEFGPRLPLELRGDFRRVLASIAEGRVEEDVPYPLLSLMRPSAQLYLASWFRYDPPTELGRLTVPVLIVQGLSDTQATMRDAQLLNAGQPRADAIVIDGVDHTLRVARATPGRRSASSMRDPLADEVLEGLASFLAQVRRR